MNVANVSAVLNFPTTVVNGTNSLENFLTPNVTAGGNVGMPTDESQIHYIFSTLDCGTNITVNQINRPRQASQVEKRIVTTHIGRVGDRAGDVCIGAGMQIATLVINAGGTAYASPTLLISAPDVDGGVQATATASVSGGIITGTVITNHGSGYLRAPSISVLDSSGHGASITPTMTPVTNFMYYCSNDYDGTTNIWTKLATQAW